MAVVFYQFFCDFCLWQNKNTYLYHLIDLNFLQQYSFFMIAIGIQLYRIKFF